MELIEGIVLEWSNESKPSINFNKTKLLVSMFENDEMPKVPIYIYIYIYNSETRVFPQILRINWGLHHTIDEGLKPNQKIRQIITGLRIPQAS